MTKLKPQLARPDFVILGVALALTVVSLIAIYDASVVQALRDFGDKYYFLKWQTLWLAIGLAVLIFLTYFDYHKLAFLAPILLAAVLGLLVMVLIPGVGTQIYGARRWLTIGAVTIQPAEITKLAYIIYLAWWLSKPKAYLVGSLLPFLLVSGLIAGLIVLEPDLGTAFILVAIGFVIYFGAGAPLKYFLLSGPLVGVLLVAFALSAPYRMERILVFFNPLRDPQGSSYHINQILIALANGGFLGLGLGQSRQKYEYIPEVATDSIFAIIAEEVGFLGSVAIITLFIAFVYRAFKVVKLAPDRFGEMLALGITCWLGIQVIVNLAAITALLPLTGVPLPFISYGGSALIANLAAVGILLNISRQRSATYKR